MKERLQKGESWMDVLLGPLTKREITYADVKNLIDVTYYGEGNAIFYRVSDPSIGVFGVLNISRGSDKETITRDYRDFISWVNNHKLSPRPSKHNRYVRT